MMDEPIKPVILPTHLRPKMPELPPTIKTMDGMQRGYTTPQAIRVDRNGGVWIDLNAPIVQGPPQPPRAYPVIVERHGPGPVGPAGYVVGLGLAYREGYSWAPSLMESFENVQGLEQFAPVVRLI